MTHEYNNTPEKNAEKNAEKNFLTYLSIYSHKNEDKLKDARKIFNELYKKVSQIIAKSWLPEGVDIKDALIEGNSNKIKAIFKDNGADIDAFFHPFTVEIYVDRSTFLGGLEEITSPDRPIRLNIPYHPRLTESTDNMLSEWVHNDNPDEIYPPSNVTCYPCC